MRQPGTAALPKNRRRAEMKKQSKSIMNVMTLIALAAAILVAGTGLAGDLEPSATPGPTMKTLDQIPPTWDRILPAAERFVLVMGGEAVLDKETGLVWERQPSVELNLWDNTLFNCLGLETGGRKGWRLPTVEELSSLVDPTQSSPALPTGHPFAVQVSETDFQSSTYFSATRMPESIIMEGVGVWAVNFSVGGLNMVYKTESFKSWCVRGGQGYDGR